MISDSFVAPLKFQFLGFPTVSGVCGVSVSEQCGQCGKLFSASVLSPIAAVAKTQLLRHTFKTWMRKYHTSHLFQLLPFFHDIYQPPCNIYILHAGQRTPTNNLYTCTYKHNLTCMGKFKITLQLTPKIYINKLEIPRN